MSSVAARKRRAARAARLAAGLTCRAVWSLWTSVPDDWRSANQGVETPTGDTTVAFPEGSFPVVITTPP
jgi:hypothetical protein